MHLNIAISPFLWLQILILSGQNTLSMENPCIEKNVRIIIGIGIIFTTIIMKCYSKGKHLGEANLDGELDTSKKDKTKTISF